MEYTEYAQIPNARRDGPSLSLFRIPAFHDGTTSKIQMEMIPTKGANKKKKTSTATR